MRRIPRNKNNEYENKLSEIKTHVDNAYNNLLFRLTSQDESDDVINAILDLKNNALASQNPAELFQVMSNSFEVLNDNNL